jgi:hypothetical protein
VALCSLLPAHRTRARDHLARAAHNARVVFKSCAATKTDLIILSLNAAVRPGKAMRAEPAKKVPKNCGHIRLATRRVEDLGPSSRSVWLHSRASQPKVPQKHGCHPTRQSIRYRENGRWHRLAIARIVHMSNWLEKASSVFLLHLSLMFGFMPAEVEADGGGCVASPAAKLWL